MPSCLALFIVLISILIPKPEYYYNFFNLLAIFLGMCLTLPLIGIISIQRMERDKYFYNMPVPSYIISRARLKAFCLSFAVSLRGVGVFGLFIIYKLFLDPNLPNVLLNSHPNYFNQPFVVIWFIAAMIIWAYAIAFTILAAYHTRYILLSFFVIGTTWLIMLRAGLMSSLHGLGGIFRDLKSVPLWNAMLFAIMLLTLAKYSLTLTVKEGYIKKRSNNFIIHRVSINLFCMFIFSFHAAHSGSDYY